MQSNQKETIAWLFPITYSLHLCEEYWGGEGFPAWLSRIANVSFTNQEFLTLNSFALIMVTIGAALIYRNTWRWLLIALAGVVFINGSLHLVFSVLTWTYSPGLITGLLIWMPLGSITIYQQWRQASQQSLRIGIALAIGLHIIVSLLAMYA